MNPVHGLREFVQEKPRIFWAFFFSCLAAVIIAVPAVIMAINVESKLVRIIIFIVVASSVIISIILMVAYMAWQITERFSSRGEKDMRYKVSDLRSAAQSAAPRKGSQINGVKINGV